MADELSRDCVTLVRIATPVLWETNDFNGVKRRINRAELLIEAEARGIVFDEFLLDKLAIAERFLVAQSIEQHQADQPDPDSD